jgi:acetyltransferase-like isoleucine patch superfamily enzyme
MNLRLTTESLDWFEHNNVSFHNRSGVRLRPGDEVYFLDQTTVEPYVGFYAGNTLFECGYMSYTNAPLPLEVSVGRYCSITWNVSFFIYNHPYHCLSTSVFAHDKYTDLTVRTMRDFGLSSEACDFLPNPVKPPTVIENDVWIGQGAVFWRRTDRHRQHRGSRGGGDQGCRAILHRGWQPGQAHQDAVWSRNSCASACQPLVGLQLRRFSCSVCERR